MSKMLLLSMIAVLLSVKIQAEKVMLLDTTKEYKLNWQRYPEHGSTPGWIEQTYNNFYKQIRWRSYVTCDFPYPNINNWLLTPFIETRNAKKVNIEITFQIRNCAQLSLKEEDNCKEAFGVFYKTFEEAPTNESMFHLESYKFANRFTIEKFRVNSEVISREVITVPVSKRGVVFAFKDEGACVSVYAVKVYTVIDLNEATDIEITGLKIFDIKSDELTLEWDAPNINSSDPNDNIEYYEVTYFPIDDEMGKENNVLIKITEDPHITITDLKKDTEYGVRVRAKLKTGWGEFSRIVYGRTSPKVDVIGKELHIPKILSIIILCLVVLVSGTIASIVTLYLRRSVKTASFVPMKKTLL